MPGRPSISCEPSGCSPIISRTCLIRASTFAAPRGLRESRKVNISLSSASARLVSRTFSDCETLRRPPRPLRQLRTRPGLRLRYLRRSPLTPLASRDRDPSGPALKPDFDKLALRVVWPSISPLQQRSEFFGFHDGQLPRKADLRTNPRPEMQRPRRPVAVIRLTTRTRAERIPSESLTGESRLEELSA